MLHTTFVSNTRALCVCVIMIYDLGLRNQSGTPRAARAAFMQSGDAKRACINYFQWSAYSYLNCKGSGLWSLGSTLNNMVHTHKTQVDQNGIRTFEYGH